MKTGDIPQGLGNRPRDHFLRSGPLEHADQALSLFVDLRAARPVVDHHLADRFELERSKVAGGRSAIESLGDSRHRLHHADVVGGLAGLAVITATVLEIGRDDLDHCDVVLLVGRGRCALAVSQPFGNDAVVFQIRRLGFPGSQVNIPVADPDDSEISGLLVPVLGDRIACELGHDSAPGR